MCTIIVGLLVTQPVQLGDIANARKTGAKQGE
jgi:hypothetical protein